MTDWLVGVALFAGRDGDGQAVLFRGQGAGGVGSVGAGRVFELVEVELEDTGVREAMVGQAGVEEARLPGAGLPSRVNSATPGEGRLRVVPMTVGIFSVCGGL